MYTDAIWGSHAGVPRESVVCDGAATFAHAGVAGVAHPTQLLIVGAKAGSIDLAGAVAAVRAVSPLSDKDAERLSARLAVRRVPWRRQLRWL